MISLSKIIFIAVKLSCSYSRLVHQTLKSILTMEYWMPCEDLIDGCSGKNYSILVLNTPINFSFNSHFVVHLWNHAKLRITVDGGTKRWLNWLTMNKDEFDVVAEPEMITGDMDSLPAEILDQFKKTSTQIVTTPDQDETDYMKALREMKKYCERENITIDTVYVLADTCGRFDQIMGNVNTLYKCKNILGNTRIFQVASKSLTWLLEEGSHSISIPQILRDNQEWCALIPVGSPCVVTTSGLKWNLENEKLEFGGLVSSSNTYSGCPEVTVKTDNRVIWSMSLDMLL